MRTLLITAVAIAALAACQPAAAPEVEPAAETIDSPNGETVETATFTHRSLGDAAALKIEDRAGGPSFSATCEVAGPSLTLSGAVSEVAMGNMVFPYSMVFSGESFPAELVPGTETDTMFRVTAPLTPDVLSALSATTTARIFVNDGYAFVESGIDPAGEFETFAAACANLTGLTPAP